MRQTFDGPVPHRGVGPHDGQTCADDHALLRPPVINVTALNGGYQPVIDIGLDEWQAVIRAAGTPPIGTAADPVHRRHQTRQGNLCVKGSGK